MYETNILRALPPPAIAERAIASDCDAARSVIVSGSFWFNSRSAHFLPIFTEVYSDDMCTLTT
jgi:hypothetical protein